MISKQEYARRRAARQEPWKDKNKAIKEELLRDLSPAFEAALERGEGSIPIPKTIDMTRKFLILSAFGRKYEDYQFSRSGDSEGNSYLHFDLKKPFLIRLWRYLKDLVPRI